MIRQTRRRQPTRADSRLIQRRQTPTELSQTWQQYQTNRPVRLLPTCNAQLPIPLRLTRRARATVQTRFEAARRPLPLLRPRPAPIPLRKWQLTRSRPRQRLQVTPRLRRLLTPLRRPPHQNNPLLPRQRLNPLGQRPTLRARLRLLEPWP